MDIILIDSNSTRVSEHAQLLLQLGHTAWKWDVNEALRCDQGKHEPPPQNYDFALAHAGDVQGLAAAAPNCRYVAIYSGGGSPNHLTHPCIARPVNAGSPIPLDALKRICALVEPNSMDAWKNGIEQLFNAEPSLAFRLLRQAQDFCGSEESRPFPESGLTIHAPMTLDHWLEPFKTDSSKGLKQLAELIVNEDKTEAAMEVKNTISSPGDLELAVSKYLKINLTSSQS